MGIPRMANAALATYCHFVVLPLCEGVGARDDANV